jgi:hypothetical protein
VYNVETNVKVKNVGMVDEDSKDTLLRYFRKVFSGTEDSGSGGHTPRASEAVLLGVGAEFNSYPASTSGSGYAFASTVSGYPPSSTVYGAPHDSGSQAGSSSYYNPSSLYETSASASYPPTSNPYGMGSTPYSGPSDHSQSSIHSQTQYASTQVAASSHELTYNSDNTMDPSHRYSTDQYPSSNRDSHYGQGSSAAVPLNAPGYSSGFYDQQPSQYPSTVTGSSSYPQPGGGYGPSAEPYPPPGGYDSRPPHSGSALPSAYDDDIDLSVDPAREETLARKRRENRSDRRRR